MSLIVLDEQLDVPEVLDVLRKRYKAQRLPGLRPGQHILDDRVPEILLTLRHPTFITIDHYFWNRRLCHSDYAILYFFLDDFHQDRIPILLRRLLRMPEFRTRARRMGKVARISPGGVAYWQFSQPRIHRLSWN